MEIRNINLMSNRPSFGMALVKPTGKVLAQFEKDVFGDECVKLAKKGFNRLMKQQAKNTNYDVYYAPSLEKTPANIKDSGFIVYSRHHNFIVDAFPLKDVVYPNSFDRKLNSYAKEVEEELSPTGRSYLSAKALLGLLKEVLNIKLFKQEELLPGALRAACDKANKLESSISKSK
ncbi:MAG: hypothetical protein E7Z87_08725 [Cyanobacteria bacterium SIG26]|nr:hypothetical protein [Cyanobacteria bacterium SIG26]